MALARGEDTAEIAESGESAGEKVGLKQKPAAPLWSIDASTAHLLADRGLCTQQTASVQYPWPNTPCARQFLPVRIDKGSASGTISGPLRSPFADLLLSLTYIMRICLYICVRPPMFLLHRYGIKYPQMYAEQSHPNAVIFNCYQRAHQVSSFVLR